MIFETLRANDLLRDIKGRFENAHIQTAGLDARLLLCHAANISYEMLVTEPDRPLSKDELITLEGFTTRRLSGEPVSRILGAREFWSNSFVINQATLDPRPDTETVIDSVLVWVDQNFNRDTDLRILDLGTGSGCILLTLLSELRNALGVGIDISEEALEAAGHNAVQMGVFNRLQLKKSNWLEQVSGDFDIIVSNPPYIPAQQIENLKPEVRLYDPRLALDGGEDGLEAYRVIIRQMKEKLTRNTFVVFEIGDGQENAVKRLLVQEGGVKARGAFGRIEDKMDLSGKIRCIAAYYKIES